MTMSPEVEALAERLEATFADGKAAAAADGPAIAALVSDVFPDLAAKVQAKQGADKGGASSLAERVTVSNAARAACQRLARRAIAAGAAPMAWVPVGAPGPVLPLFLDRVFELGQAGFTDHSGMSCVMGLLEDVADAVSGDGCGDVLAWLTAREQTFRELRESKMPVLRLCNRMLARLSRASEPQLVAGLLVFLSKVFPLNERSGLNVLGAAAPALIGAPEEVPAGALDSNGQPVDALLYAATWGLQPLLHNPREVAAPDNWAKFMGDVRTVLAALAAQPAQVAAGAVAVGGGGGGSSGSGMDVDAGGESTVGYLSSPQLFGLQLRDAIFRRDLLVQVLITLQAVRQPVKPTDAVLRTKQLPEAAALEAEVYAALEATPDNGAAFAAAVRNTLRREEGWAQWKKGAPPPLPTPKDGKGPACPDYERPPLRPPIAERVAEGAAGAGAAAAKAGARREALLAALAREKRSALEMESVDDMLAPRKRIKTDSEVLRGVSRLDTWVFHVPDSNMEGLKVHERAGFPSLELLARPALEQMDPESAIDNEYRLVHQDPVYRWRMARLMARHWPGSQSVAPLPPWMPPSYKDRLTSAVPDEIEYVLGRIMPNKVSEAWVAQALEKVEADKAKAAAAKAAAAGGSSGGAGGGDGEKAGAAGGGGTAAASPAGTGGAGAAAGGPASGDDATAGGDGGGEGAEAAGADDAEAVAEEGAAEEGAAEEQGVDAAAEQDAGGEEGEA